MTKKESLEELKLFIAKFMNEEQDNHAKATEKVKNYLGQNLGQDTIKIMNEIYRARVEVLNKMYHKIQELE